MCKGHLSTISDRLNFAAKRSFSNIGKAYKNRIYYKTDSRKPLSEGWGLADNDIIKISDYAGSTVYRGTEHKIYLNASGVYIVEVKGTTLKIHVK